MGIPLSRLPLVALCCLMLACDKEMSASLTIKDEQSAQEFVAQLNEELDEVIAASSIAGWVRASYLTDDTAFLAAQDRFIQGAKIGHHPAILRKHLKHSFARRRQKDIGTAGFQFVGFGDLAGNSAADSTAKGDGQILRIPRGNAGGDDNP